WRGIRAGQLSAAAVCRIHPRRKAGAPARIGYATAGFAPGAAATGVVSVAIAAATGVVSVVIKKAQNEPVRRTHWGGHVPSSPTLSRRRERGEKPVRGFLAFACCFA